MPSLLDKALKIAIAAAQEAGAHIRADFHRPGGPRGHGSHAKVDDQAEALIRARLRAAFPDWAYLGEETGADGPSDAPFRWLVDPNDGTKSFLRGHRGTSVSIALVGDGVPVLGVVYAPLAPDDHGDLIAWADGQPLTRNQRPIERAPSLFHARPRRHRDHEPGCRQQLGSQFLLRGTGKVPRGPEYRLPAGTGGSRGGGSGGLAQRPCILRFCRGPWAPPRCWRRADGRSGSSDHL